MIEIGLCPPWSILGGNGQGRDILWPFFLVEKIKEPMEGDCKMEAQPLKSYDKSVQTQIECKDICDAEPKCKYYIYDKDWTCTLYADTKRSCISFIGAARRSKCDSGNCFNLFLI